MTAFDPLPHNATPPIVSVKAARGRTLILVTHDLELAAMADEVMVLRDGRVIERREKDA